MICAARKTDLLGVATLAICLTGTRVDATEMPGPYGFTPADPVVHDWNGFYAGIFGSVADAGADGALPGNYSGDGDGFGGGIMAGVSQHAGRFVFGAEMDFALSDADVDANAGGNPLSVTASWITTLRGRTGLTVNDMFVYGTAGIALGDIDVSLPAGSDGAVGVGWVAGAGIEFPLGNQFTARAEYLFTDFGRINGSVGGTAFDTQYDSHQIRAGITYRFR